MFAGLLATLAIVSPATDAQRAAADPLVQLLDGRGGPWPIVAATLVCAAIWRRVARIRVTRRDLGWALAGVATATLIALGLRTIVGPSLPSLIPSEESARPGMTLGLAAGLMEEIVFRLALLPSLFSAAARRLDRSFAIALAVLATGALFSLSHELGPGGGSFDPRYMLTRFLVPGVAMSVVALRINMTFLVFAHCSAHLLLPSMFPG